MMGLLVREGFIYSADKEKEMQIWPTHAQVINSVRE
jgi:hypothetical protein